MEEEGVEEIENYEYEEDSSGTQYEINDEDKLRIENEKKKNQATAGEEKKQGDNKL